MLVTDNIILRPMYPMQIRTISLDKAKSMLSDSQENSIHILDSLTFDLVSQKLGISGGLSNTEIMLNKSMNLLWIVRVREKIQVYLCRVV